MTQPSIGLSHAVDKPTKLFLMTNSFETGGSEKQCVTLARSFESTWLRPHIGCISKRGALLDGHGEIPEFPVGGNLYGTESMRARWRLARYLLRCDIGVAHSFDFYTNLLMVPAAKLAGVSAVIGSQRQLGDLLSPAKSRAQLVVLRWCDRVVCNSHAAAKRLIAQGMPEGKTVVICNGLAASAFAPAVPVSPRSVSQFRVGMIARMNSLSKNHGMFLRAAARVHSRFPGTEFVLAGDGLLKPELEILARELGIGHQVRFLGDRRDIPAVLASFDISVLPSASESLSNAILESMAAGIPVVAADVGGNPELLAEDRGILIPAGNEERLAGEIERLLANPSLQIELGTRAKQFAQANCAIESVSKRHAEVYAEILDEKKWRRTRNAHPRSLANAKVVPKRVLIIAASSRYVGGQSVQAGLLVKRWEDDPEFSAIMVPIDPPFPAILKWAEQIPVVRTIVRQPLYLCSLWRGLRDADIAHIFSASYWSFLIATAPAAVIARLKGKRVLIHYHSGEARDHLQRSHVARSILARADRLVVPSGYLVDVFREFRLHAEAVPNFLDVSQFSFRDRAALRPHLVCTRGFHPYYCIDIVVRAFAEVKKAYPAARLDLVGGGPLEGAVRELVRQLNVNDVRFVGIASRQEIPKFYDQADIFINASCLDNMPVSVLEAFACGTPIVSTAPESMRYLIEHGQTGLLSPPGDSHALAENVMRLLRDPALARSIIANAHEQSKNFQWSVIRQQWIDVYRSLALLSPQDQEGTSAS